MRKRRCGVTGPGAARDSPPPASSAATRSARRLRPGTLRPQGTDGRTPPARSRSPCRCSSSRAINSWSRRSRRRSPPRPASSRHAAASVPSTLGRLAATPTPTASAGPAQPAIADERERRIEVESTDLSIAFTNRGARLLSWRLQGFLDERGRPEEMVQASAGAGRGPSTWRPGIATLDARLRERAVPRLDGEPQGQRRRWQRRLRFEYAEGELSAEKIFRFPASGTTARVSARVKRAGTPLPVRLVWGPGVSNPTARGDGGPGYQPPQAVSLGPGGVERKAPETLTAPSLLTQISWVGIETQLLHGALGARRRRRAAPRSGPWSCRQPPRASRRASPKRRSSLGPEGEALLYVGPKDYRTLARSATAWSRWCRWEPGSARSWSRSWSCSLVHGYVGNYGWSIVVLTVLINLVMGPLRHYSIANGLKMAKLAPEMRGDPGALPQGARARPEAGRRCRRRSPALYARHGMNMSTQMLVGCLPILLTMPFLIAFYRVLTVVGRAAGRAVPVDPRPLPEGPAVRDPRADGRLDVRDAEDDAHGHGPGPAADHDDHAAGAGGDVLRGARRASTSTGWCRTCARSSSRA